MIADPIEHFLVWCARDRGRSVRTIARYRITLTTAEDACGNLITADIADLEEWWESRYGHAPATRANELACLRSFYKWATRFDHRPDDPTRRLDPPKIPNHIPRPIGEADLSRLLGELTADAPDLRRAVALGAYAGLRVSEVAGLSWADVDQDRRRIYVRGKGGKERAFGLSPVLLDKILPETVGNVVTAGGDPYTGAVLQRKINRLMSRHRIGHTFHNLRARAATLALAKGENTFAVAMAFGWSSVETAKSYAVVGDEALDRIAAAVV